MYTLKISKENQILPTDSYLRSGVRYCILVFLVEGLISLQKHDIFTYCALKSVTEWLDGRRLEGFAGKL